MPDFSAAGCERYWQERHDLFLRKIIKIMEDAEHWTLEANPEVEAALVALGKELDTVKDFEIQDEEKFIKLLAHIKTSRMLHIMQSLDVIKPGTASKLLIYAEVAAKGTSTYQGLFLNRNLIFERLQLLSRVFAPERFRLVSQAIEQAEG